jgi:hypothetical protein
MALRLAIVLTRHHHAGRNAAGGDLGTTGALRHRSDARLSRARRQYRAGGLSPWRLHDAVCDDPCARGRIALPLGGAL